MLIYEERDVLFQMLINTSIHWGKAETIYVFGVFDKKWRAN